MSLVFCAFSPMALIVLVAMGWFTRARYVVDFATKYGIGLQASSPLSNSLTGLSISGASSGLALAMYLQSSIPITSNLWFWLFGFQAILYVTVIGALVGRQGRKAAQ